MKARKVSSIKPRKKGVKRPKYSATKKLEFVRLIVEDGYSLQSVKDSSGVSINSLHTWVKLYKDQGEAGLQPKPRPGGKKLPKPVKDKIIELKKENPSKGSLSISQILRRMFFLEASPETVRKELHKENLIPKTKPKPKKNPAKPRRFERSTPNQMWQSDIMCFRLGGKNAYLIGYIDDYSRFITGLGLYYSQTAQNVLETYRRAVSENSLPKEMLTDNGRQYTNWRGKTKFEKEMQKDGIHHFRSSPKHPQTLGKIERFWKTILDEFLGKCRFDSFEDARIRLRKWVDYYNHRRPHQGIEGLCPADRYFEVNHELKKVIQQGVEENILELALRGEPKEPFYMVGRMDGQSVILKAEKGSLKLSVDGKERQAELNYNLKGENHGEESNQGTQEKSQDTQLQRSGESESNSSHMDRTSLTLGNLPRDGHPMVHHQQLAESSLRSDASITGTQSQPREGSSSESEITEVTSEKGSFDNERRISRESEIRCEVGEDFTEIKRPEESVQNIFPAIYLGAQNEPTRQEEPQGSRANEGVHESSSRNHHSSSGSPRTGDLSPGVLRMGSSRNGGFDDWNERPSYGSSQDRSPDRGEETREEGRSS